MTFASNHFSRVKLDACHKNYFIMKLSLGQEYTFQEKNNEIIATFNLYLNLATYQEQQVKWKLIPTLFLF